MARRVAAAGALALALGAGASARAEPDRGAVTDLPLPRFVSLKAAKGNVRRGPSLSHRIDWVFTRRHMPLQITGEYGHWRRVRDRDGAGGWMHYALLSGVRTVIVTQPMTALRRKPSADATILARAEADVVADLDQCLRDWCSVSVAGRGGWIRRDALWGVAAEDLQPPE